MPARRDIKAPEKVDIQMTPMIDIVFQLMAFFLMTFKVAAVEGDFNLKLPKQERSEGVSTIQNESITVRLRTAAGGKAGRLAQLIIGNGRPLVPASDADKTPFRNLTTFVLDKVKGARDAGQEEPEIQIDADDQLAYEFIIDTIQAVSVTSDGEGNPVQLAKKVKFAPKDHSRDP